MEVSTFLLSLSGGHFSRLFLSQVFDIHKRNYKPTIGRSEELSSDSKEKLINILRFTKSLE